MPRPFRNCLGAAAAAALLAACTDDPFDRPGTMAPRGFNDANLRAMVVDPAHLRRGLEATTTRGDAAARPVDLLRSGKRVPLAGSGSSTPSLDVDGGGSGNGGR
jgi:type IV pilus biogenesis protein CpaD/CtpE